MVKRCIYCNYELEEDSVIDICETCMYKVWGEKMAGAIVDNMKREKANGNLELGKVGEKESETVEDKKLEIKDEIIEAEEVIVREKVIAEAEEVIEAPLKTIGKSSFDAVSFD